MSSPKISPRLSRFALFAVAGSLLMAFLAVGSQAGYLGSIKELLGLRTVEASARVNKDAQAQHPIVERRYVGERPAADPPASRQTMTVGYSYKNDTSPPLR